MTTRRRPRPNRATVLAQFNELIDVANWIEQHADEWQGPSSSQGGSAQGGTHSDPTAATAIAPPDETQKLIDDANHLHTEVAAIEDRIMNLKGFAAKMRPLTQEQARTTKTPDKRPGVGACAACGDWVTGVDPDRLKAGYCPRHYQQWVRADRPDRNEFQEQVRLENARAS